MNNDSTINNIFNKIHLIKARDIWSFALILPALPYSWYLRARHGEIWLVREREEQARDNGYAFFLKNIENDKNVELYYSISKKSEDYTKLKKYEPNVLEFGSCKHWAYYIACRACVSAVKRNAPAALPNLVFRRLGLMANKSYFLGHGITKDNADWLHYKNTKFRMFFCGAKPEYDYVKENYGYPDGAVVYAGGLCRYDLLHDAQPDNRTILLMPTWRVWLEPGSPRIIEVEGTADFLKTDYYLKWMEFLNSKEIEDILAENTLDVVFYLHPQLQKYREHFHTTNKRIHIASQENTDLQFLIKSSKMLITDYSSVYFDFIYQKKPVVYYQFDEAKYRAYHYKEGWFNYHANPFGKCFTDVKDLAIELRKIIKSNFKPDTEYLEAHKELFPVCDDRNSERTFNTIYNSLH